MLKISIAVAAAALAAGLLGSMPVSAAPVDQDPWWGAEPVVDVAAAPGAYDPGYADEDGPAYDDPNYDAAPSEYDGDQAYVEDQSDPHVQWCMNRYQSYDPQTDTFMGYDGIAHPCTGPY
jgi:hypothetical protein